MRAISATDLEKFLKERIRGQEEAIERIARAVARSETGFSKPERLHGGFLFLGPTGVGKTELCLQLCEHLYGDATEHHFQRFDMAEYQHADTVQRFVGEKRGDDGLLGEAVDRINAHGGGIILFDEIEKANQQLSTLFLAMLDAARFTPASGQTRDLSKFYIVATSNLGSMETVRMEHVPYETIRRFVTRTAEEYFRPEVLARWSEVVVFNRLSYEVQLEICKLMMEKELAHVTAVLKREVTTSEEVFSFLVRHGFEKYLGARPMRRCIENRVQDALHEWEAETKATRPENGSNATPLILRVDDAHDRLYASLLTKF